MWHVCMLMQVLTCARVRVHIYSRMPVQMHIGKFEKIHLQQLCRAHTSWASSCAHLCSYAACLPLQTVEMHTPAKMHMRVPIEVCRCIHIEMRVDKTCTHMPG
jgi:hypothetical protein